MEINNKIANIVSDYWVARIQNTKHDNGAYDFENFMANYLADQCVEKISQEQLNSFKVDLMEKIIELLEETKKSPFYDLYLGCDYSPCRDLYDIAKKYNIPELNFPFKVSMWFNRHHVSVSGSYGAKVEILYADKEYYEHLIEGCKSAIKTYESGEYHWLSREEEQESINSYKKEIEYYKEEIRKLKEVSNENS